ncbi:hypothetical protein MBLNU230_g6137t1 [Neophaeotheca triangularis]
MTSPNPTRITVLISGGGTNLQALIDASQTPAQLPNTTFIRVISDRKNAYGLTRAASANIPTTTHGILPYKKSHPDPADGSDPQQSPSRAAYDADLAKLVLADGPDMVVCAGFMRIVTPAFLLPLQERKVPIINLHPSLHGDLVGANCIEKAWGEFEAGERKMTGVMVHYVITEVDMGDAICEAEVGIEGCKSLGELEERMHRAEHGLIVEGTRKVAESLRSGDGKGE